MTTRIPFWQRWLIRFMERRWNSVRLADGTHLVRMSPGLARWLFKDGHRGWDLYADECRSRGEQP